MLRLHVAAGVLASVVMAIGTLVLVGWALNIDAIKSILPGLATMKVNTALCFLLSGISLLSYLQNRPPLIYRITVGIALGISALTLAQYAFNVNLGLDELFFKDAATLSENFPGRMSIATSIGFILFSLSLISLYAKYVKTAQVIAIVGNSFVTVPLLGYLFNVEGLYDVSIFSSIAIHTVLTFATLGTAILFSRADSEIITILKDESSAGKLLRRSIPIAFVVPITLGLLTTLAENAHIFNPVVGRAILVQTIILIVLLSLWLNARIVLQDQKMLKDYAEQLSISREKFMSIFQEVSDVILIIDGDKGTILTVNPACNVLLNYPPESLIGQHFKSLFKDSIEPGFLEKITFVRDILLEQPVRKVDGTFLPMDVTAKVLLWEGERAVLVTLRDASERKRIEEELMLLRLQQIEIEKDQELIALKEAFIAGISHDFKNPLSVISLSSDILHRYYDRLNMDQTLSHLERIRFQAHFMKEMIDDVMTYVESQQGEILTQLQAVNVIDLCNTVIQDFRYQYASREINLSVKNNPGRLLLDPRLMRRAISNLLSNALKYSSEGKPVDVRLMMEKDTLIVEIEDHGIGIPAQDEERMFKAFQRASNVNHIKGTGLGLVIVQECAAIHNGTVNFRTREGSGTTFTLRIPKQSLGRGNMTINSA